MEPSLFPKLDPTCSNTLHTVDGCRIQSQCPVYDPTVHESPTLGENKEDPCGQPHRQQLAEKEIATIPIPRDYIMESMDCVEIEDFTTPCLSSVPHDNVGSIAEAISPQRGKDDGCVLPSSRPRHWVGTRKSFCPLASNASSTRSSGPMVRMLITDGHCWAAGLSRRLRPGLEGNTPL